MKGDTTVETAAEKLEQAARKASARGGVGGRIASELSEDARFLRKLKPSLVRRRLRGKGPRRRAPSGPQLPRAAANGSEGPNPLAVLGAALAAGIALAKLVDWRGHAHPRR